MTSACSDHANILDCDVYQDLIEEYINHIRRSTPLVADPPWVDAPWNKPNWITTEFSLLYAAFAHPGHIDVERTTYAARDTI